MMYDDADDVLGARGKTCTRKRYQSKACTMFLSIRTLLLFALLANAYAFVSPFGVQTRVKTNLFMSKEAVS
jgi:hypothetical protein